MKIDLLIIGAGRAGTTTICKYLEQHPDICFSSIKEVHYFSIEDLYKRNTDYYHSFFSHYSNEKMIASADTYLLMDYDAIERIKKYNPKMKILVMLRNPVDRAYSSYNYSINYGYHKALNSFTDCIKMEENIEMEKDIVQQNNLGHLYGSLYAKHLKKWTDAFPIDNFLFIKTKDLKSNIEEVLQKISAFLSIDTFTINEESKQKQLNSNAKPKSKILEQFLLNRNSFVRTLIRKIVPQFVKQLIIKSNVVDKIHAINREASEYIPLSDQEISLLRDYFKSDMEELNKSYRIEF